MTPFPSLARRLRRGAIALAATAALAACGGGSSQVEKFNAQQVYAFGDEASLLTSDGRKYSVNALDDSDVLACEGNPIWVQTVATFFGHVFAECNPEGVAEPQAFMRAAAGATTADLVTQIDAVESGTGFGVDALATVLVGANDVLEMYSRYDPANDAQALAEARTLGESVGGQVNRLVALGVRVIVATVPDQGLTPFALAEKAAHSDYDRAEVLTNLTREFNAGLRVTMVNDGRQVGLVLADEMVQAMVKNPGNFGLSNATTASCTVDLPDCTDNTLVSGASPSNRLWADDRQLSYGGQARLGLLAQTRARDNPF